MRILWISFLGSWTFPLLNQLKERNVVGIIIPNVENNNNYFIKDQISFFYLPLNKKELYGNMGFNTYLKYKKCIDLFNPDIIHIHGTEKNLGQIQNYIKEIPIIISIQGLLTGCKNYTLNYINKNEVIKNLTLKNLFGFGGIGLMKRDIKKGEVHELDILQNGKYFFGRTNWDKSHILFHNTKAKYFIGEELLREEFYKNRASWDINNCQRYSIFMPSGFNPIKGLHLAIMTTILLKQYFPNILLSIPGISMNHIKRFYNRFIGEEYIIYCIRLVKKYKIDTNIRFLPRLDANAMIKEMQKAHVFLSPTSIDNSPNAIGEAMMIGTPIVTTPVGGITSFIHDEIETLYAPAGDTSMMAFQIKRIFEEDNLAISLSKNAHQVALRRHNIENTKNQYLQTYKQIINLHKQ